MGRYDERTNNNRNLIIIIMAIVGIGIFFITVETFINKAKGNSSNNIVSNPIVTKIVESELNPINLPFRVIEEMGKRNMENVAKIQRINDKNLRDVSQRHDNEHPSFYPSEWDSISNSREICYFHKITRKKICEELIK